MSWKNSPFLLPIAGLSDLPWKGSEGSIEQALHLEHMTLPWVRMVRVYCRLPYMVWAIRYSQSTRFFDCPNSNITLWRRDQRTTRRNHFQQMARLSDSQRLDIGGRVRCLSDASFLLSSKVLPASSRISLSSSLGMVHFFNNIQLLNGFPRLTQNQRHT